MNPVNPTDRSRRSIQGQPGRSGPRALGCFAAAFLLAAPALAQKADPELAKYFGWDEPRIIVVDNGTGPALAADFNADGLTDLAVVNNAKSRIELHLQRRTPRTDEDVQREAKVNEMPPSKFFDRADVSVAHRVTGFRAADATGDGLMDIVYAGLPAELVVLEQKTSLKFDVRSKRRIKDLAAGQDGIELANVVGDSAPDLIVLVSGRLNIFQMTAGEVVGEPLELGSGGTAQQVAAFFVEDYNGDSRLDIAAAIPDDEDPVRLWLQSASSGMDGQGGAMGPELRFEMPALRELEPVRLPGAKAASLAIIERASRRIVLSDLMSGPGTPRKAGSVVERDAAAEIVAYPGQSNKGRSVVVGDLNADGLPDLLATDQQGNSLVLYRQVSGSGLAAAERFSALKDPRTVAMGQWDQDPALEVFVLSEADKVVGIADFDAGTGRLNFPQPVTLATGGASPVAMGYANLGDAGPGLAIIVKDKRDHTLEIHRPEAPAATLKLEGVSRPPQSLLAGDFDHDGKTDLVLFTPSEPLIMVRSVDGAASDAAVLTDKSMPQFGLVQAAGPDNTAMLDVDGDGHPELLLADQNFVRACAFSVEKGWRVIEQITLPESGVQLVGLTVLDRAGEKSIIAYDKANSRLVLMSRGPDRAWQVSDRLRFGGFEASSIHAGAFGGDGAAGVLASSDSAFAVIRLDGTRYGLDEFAAFRSDADDRLEHEIEVGDLNNDGYIDLVCLDARDQMCQVFTVTASRRLLLATEFKVFESRLFGRGDTREFEPSAAIIADLTGDGLQDLVLQVHDRYLVYPQMGAK